MNSKLFVQQQHNQKKMILVETSDSLNELLTNKGIKLQKDKFIVGMALGDCQNDDSEIDLESFLSLSSTGEDILAFSQQQQDEPRIKLSNTERSEEKKSVVQEVRCMLH